MRSPARLVLPDGTACIIPNEADSSPDPSTGGGGKADGSEPTLTFGKDWSEKVTGTLLAGSPVRISYALDRLPEKWR